MTAARPPLRLNDTPCPKCKCYVVQDFKCNCGEKHGDHCINCGRFTSVPPTMHIELHAVDAVCTQGHVMHDHPPEEQAARISKWFAGVRKRKIAKAREAMH